MTTKAVESVQIKTGPSREALFDALKYACDKENPHTVEFEGFYGRDGDPVRAAQMRFRMCVQGIRHEDGSGLSFIVKGHIIGKSRFPGMKEFYYNARTRTGYMRLTPH